MRDRPTRKVVATMLYKEIEAIYTARVSEYIGKGYTVNTRTMSGHQGEVAKVDLRKGDEIVRILLDTEIDYARRFDKVVLIVGRCVEPIGSYGTIWNSKLEVIEEVSWFKVSEDYYCDADEADAVKEKTKKRWANSNKRDVIDFGDEAKKIVLPFVKRQHGCKTCKVGEIDRVYKRLYEGKWIYCVNARGNHYVLG